MKIGMFLCTPKGSNINTPLKSYAPVSFCAMKPKNIKQTLNAIDSYGRALVEKSKMLTVVKEIVGKNGLIKKYMSDGSVIVTSSNNATKPIKSKISSDIVKSKEWKSNPKREFFEEACAREFTSCVNTGIKKIEPRTKEAIEYIKRGYTHEVKVKSDYRMFGKQLEDGSYEWSLFEHSKMHR